ncbi:hypothetical protein FA95DRAFT_1456442, partial [Auriscalpium vulgare]
RDAINLRKVHTAAKNRNEEVKFVHARDKVAKTVLTRNSRRELRRLSSTVAGDFLGSFPYVTDMKVMIHETTAMAHSVVNGSEGILKDMITGLDADGEPYAVCALVSVPGCGITCPGLPQDIVPIFPVAKTFRYRSRSHNKSFSVTREQLPLLPAYAFTDYKSQGRSLDNVIVDVRGCRSSQSLYVMLSRVRTLRGLAILQYFAPEKITKRLPHDLVDELRRLEALAERT